MDAVIPFPAQAAARRPASLRIHLLGRFEVVRGGAPVPRDAWRRRRPADVLTLLALAPGHEMPRDRLVETLWPGKDAASAANNLHRALYDLRQVLGGRHVEVDRSRAVLLPGAWVDVVAFEEAVARGDLASLQAAVSLYRGDLVPDDADSPWLAARREALRRTFALAAWPVAEEAPSPQAAIPLLRRALDAEPTNERAWRHLLRRLAEAGRRADALRQFDACVAALRARGLAGPSDETRSLRDAIQRGEVGPRRAPEPWSGWRRAVRRLFGSPEPRPLRGREPVSVLLESLLAQGHGALLLLGEAGVGKTRLALEAARIAEERGAVVLSGVAGAAPGSVLRSALDDYDDAVGLPGSIPSTSLDAAPRILRAIGGGKTVVLVAEDLHLADESSLHLLHQLVHHAASIPLALVATVRDEEVTAGSPVAAFLAHLGGERGVRGVRLPRLALEATRLMVSDVVGAMAPDGLGTQIHRATDGNPFFVAQLARGFRELGRLDVVGDAAEAVRARVARLDRRVQSVLAAAAVLGMRFDFELLHATVSMTGRDLLATLDLCLESRLLSEEGDGLRFRHALVREALLENLTEDRARVLHAAAAEALAAREEGPGGDGRHQEAIGRHRRAAGDVAGAVAPLVAAAAWATQRGGLAEAARILSEALECAEVAGVGGELRHEVHEALGRARLALGDLTGAVHAFRSAAAVPATDAWTPVAEVRARAARLEALARLAAGRVDEAVALLVAIPPDVGDGRERAEAVRLLAAIAAHRGGASPEVLPEDDPAPGSGAADPYDVHLVLWEQDLVGWRTAGDVLAHARAAREAARDRGDAVGEAVARAAEGAALLAEGTLDLAEPALLEASAALAEHRHAQGEAFALERLGTLLAAQGKLDEGLSVLRDGLLAAERAPLRWHALTRVHAAVALNRRQAGALRAAEDAAREASEAAAHHGDCLACHALLEPREGT